MSAFPIGFWNYANIDKQDASAVEDWADAGMTLAMGPNYGPDPTEVDKMRTILDAAHAKDIRVILCERRTSFRSLTEAGEEAYRRECAEAAAALGDHPAVFGFHVGDEPRTDTFAAACKAMRIQKELAPHLTPFLNLLPWNFECHLRVGYHDWSEYLDRYVADAKPEVLSYDCYTQMWPGTAGWDMYFRNLRLFAEASARHAIPFWTTLLSVGHWNYRCPTEDDLRWQISTAVAHGAKGLLWFFFYMREPHDNYRVSPIDEHWERTETFEWLSRTCRTFLKTIAPVLSELTLQRVSHVGTAWGGTPIFRPNELIERVVSPGRNDLIVSEFRDAADRDYVLLVNNSLADSTHAEVTVRGRRPRLIRVGWQAKESPVQLKAGPYWRYVEEEDQARIRIWLAPGQMDLYRVECRSE